MFPLALCALLPAIPFGEEVVQAAQTHLGTPYVFGGRLGRPGCREQGQPSRCLKGIDCQSLIFFAYEKVIGRPWTHYSVMPSVSVRRQELGVPVPGLAGIPRDRLVITDLAPGDVLFFLLEDYNLAADSPLWVYDGRRYGVWHTGLVASVGSEGARVLHAKPGDKVIIEPLDLISFEALFVVRGPPKDRTTTR